MATENETKLANVNQMIADISRHINELCIRRKHFRDIQAKYIKAVMAEREKEAESRRKYERAMKELEEFNRNRFNQ